MELGEYWAQWQRNWRWMEELAHKRGWRVSELAIAAPARQADIAAIEAQYGKAFAPYLRAVLTQCSAHVRFGWHVPSHLTPLDDKIPTSSTNPDAVWNLAHIADDALPAIRDWQAMADDDAHPARPDLPTRWEDNFPFCVLANGDLLTIDCTHRDPAQQPVRYYSHEGDMLHGLALAPDFLSYITTMSQLGHAGTEWHSMILFGDYEGADKFTLDADGPGAQRWRAWLASDPAVPLADTPPRVLVEQSAADRALLDATRAGSRAGVAAALRDGARPDCTFDSKFIMRHMLWNEQFYTPISYAVRHNDIAMLDQLLAAGAILNTRVLPLNVAVKEAGAQMLEALVARGARAVGWKGQQDSPLYDLIRFRGTYAKYTAQSYWEQEHRAMLEYDEAALARAEQTGDAKMIAAMRAKIAEHQRYAPKMKQQTVTLFANHVNHPTYLHMLEALLRAGADPNPTPKCGANLLRLCDPEAAELLLRYGANVNHCDDNGSTALHLTNDPQLAQVLVAHGGDVNFLAPTIDPDYPPKTPLHSALVGRSVVMAKTLIELGADPHLCDGGGFPALAYCTSLAAFELIESYGADPLAPLPGGGTLLHRCVEYGGGLLRASWPNEVALLDHMLARGIDINARDDLGRTALHVAAKWIDRDEPANVQLMLERGADPALRDNNGKRLVDFLPRKLRAVRAALK